MNFLIFSIFLVLLTSCGYRTKYCANNDFSPQSTEVNNIKNNIKRYHDRYSDLVKDYWEPARLKGFLYDKNDNQINTYDYKNTLEFGLGYIFFNTLRAKLHRTVNHTDLGIWENNGPYSGFICPKPWKYKRKRIGGSEYGVFYLDCVQMGEYFDLDESRPLRNYDLIYNADKEGKSKPNGKSPYMKVYYTDGNQKEYSDFILNVDHLLRDNCYLIELPQKLHHLKTSILDPFILSKTQTVRTGTDSISASTYWRATEDYQNAKRTNCQAINICRCGDQFLPPTEDGIIDHVHNMINNEEWGKNWIANMKKENIVQLY